MPDITALIGGSGSGKSVMSRSIMGLIDEPGKIVGGEVWLNGRDLRTLSEKQMRKVRGREIAMIFQEPTAAMNPVIKVKNHLFEAARFYERKKTRAEKLADFRDVLQRVGLRNPDQILEAYPFELSGGMCQRVMVAMGMIASANF
ncbi:MAG: ATP-binding cassette domain-containing protein [Oscillospiraceae bacterium]